jgi:hypothetical protein
MEMKIKKCSHPFFYTIDDNVYCNECHKDLGYFNSSDGSFIKEIRGTIQDEYLNEKMKKYKKPEVIADSKSNHWPALQRVEGRVFRDLIPPNIVSRPCNPPRPGGR